MESSHKLLLTMEIYQEQKDGFKASAETSVNVKSMEHCQHKI